MPLLCVSSLCVNYFFSRAVSGVQVGRDVIATKVGALGPSGPFGRYGPVQEGGPGGPLAAAGEVEGYGAAGAGGGAPGIGASANPRIREATLGAPCCAPLPVTQAHHIGKRGNCKQ